VEPLDAHIHLMLPCSLPISGVANVGEGIGLKYPPARTSNLSSTHELWSVI
jgi:hypothetical protein